MSLSCFPCCRRRVQANQGPRDPSPPVYQSMPPAAKPWEEKKCSPLPPTAPRPKAVLFDQSGLFKLKNGEWVHRCKNIKKEPFHATIVKTESAALSSLSNEKNLIVKHQCNSRQKTRTFVVPQGYLYTIHSEKQPDPSKMQSPKSVSSRSFFHEVPSATF